MASLSGYQKHLCAPCSGNRDLRPHCAGSRRGPPEPSAGIPAPAPPGVHRIRRKVATYPRLLVFPARPQVRSFGKRPQCMQAWQEEVPVPPESCDVELPGPPREAENRQAGGPTGSVTSRAAECTQEGVTGRGWHLLRLPQGCPPAKCCAPQTSPCPTGRRALLRTPR